MFGCDYFCFKLIFMLLKIKQINSPLIVWKGGLYHKDSFLLNYDLKTF